MGEFCRIPRRLSTRSLQLIGSTSPLGMKKQRIKVAGQMRKTIQKYRIRAHLLRRRSGTKTNSRRNNDGNDWARTKTRSSEASNLTVLCECPRWSRFQEGVQQL